MKITTAAEMAAIDRATSERHGVDSLTLMENAGTAVADFARQHWPTANRITVVCGKGACTRPARWWRCCCWGRRRG
jgi:NAD(P)H-hydrate repair Nnr-like enzyme with NAD(P)H-hydrate epimerase domain